MLAQTYEQGAPFIRPVGMDEPFRVQQIAAGRPIPLLIAEHAIQHQDFLTRRVRMAGEAATRPESDKGRNLAGLRRALVDQALARHTVGWALDPIHGGGIAPWWPGLISGLVQSLSDLVPRCARRVCHGAVWHRMGRQGEAW
jgi:hypothetical protein